MAASGWFSSWLSMETISPTLASRAEACRRSCVARVSASARRCSVRSMTALIQPVCRPVALISGASITRAGKRTPSLRMNSVSKPSRGGSMPSRRKARRLAYSDH